MSPTKMNRSMGQMAASPAPAVATPKPVGGFLTPTAANIRTPSSEKPGGPPVNGLFSTPKRLQPRHFGTPSSMTPMGGTPLGGASTPVPTTPHLSFGGTPHMGNVSKVADYSQRLVNQRAFF